MNVEYFYCPHCGIEAYDVYVAYARTTASGDVFICPQCGGESMFAESEEDAEWGRP